jgi:HEAT repeat protein
LKKGKERNYEDKALLVWNRRVHPGQSAPGGAEKMKNLVTAAAAVALLASAGLPQTGNPNEERAKSLLVAALRSNNGETRRHAIEALSLLNSSGDWLAPLEQALEDKRADIQLAAIATILDLKPEHASDMIQKALKGPTHEVSFAAAKALWSLKDPAGENALLSVLSGEIKTSSNLFTQQKRDALRMMRTPRGTFLFVVSTGTQVAPVPGLGLGASSVQGLMNDPTLSGRATAALLLANDPNPNVVDALKDSLKDKNWGVRAASVNSLALHNDRGLAPLLLPQFDDTNDAVRVRAAAGYLRLTGLK